ncbi:MAG TPA: hypothetical protein VI522_07430, partial [Gammaproteobacteria bacterium]|nr:hypothetical protein [Gammaproteobacteria bacterium]
MLSELRLWSQKINAGLDIAHNFHFKQSAALPSGVKKIAFVGMGGSGIAGQIIATFLEKRTKVASCIIDGPVVPQHVDTGTF